MKPTSRPLECRVGLEVRVFGLMQFTLEDEGNGSGRLVFKMLTYTAFGMVMFVVRPQAIWGHWSKTES